MTAEAEFAPAKVNLTLHVTGQRDDGYHLLDSLVVFAPVGDTVTVAPAPDLTLKVTGLFADGLPTDSGNLVMQAASALAPGRGAAITLEKRLPVSSGLGGGSSDAAAALRALARLWDVPLPEPDTFVSLGADVPVCLERRATRMRGIGEKLDALPGPVPFHILLVNPNVSVSTLDIFAVLPERRNDPMPDIPPFTTARDVAEFAARCRNDLQAPALTLVPEIVQVLTAIRATEGCLLARMSGSGATCFGLYADEVALERARDFLTREHRDWWVAA